MTKYNQRVTHDAITIEPSVTGMYLVVSSNHFERRVLPTTFLLDYRISRAIKKVQFLESRLRVEGKPNKGAI
jgi:hypothetical protein